MISRKTLVLSTHSSIPCSSFSGTTEYVRISPRQPPKQGGVQSCRRLDSTFFLSNLLMILLKSMSRASLRRSSFGLTRNGYFTPSVPRTMIFLGFCIEFMTSTSSSKATLSRHMGGRHFVGLVDQKGRDYAFSPSGRWLREE